MNTPFAVRLERTSLGTYVARNPLGAEIEMGPASKDHLSPVELLLAAIAGCSAVDVDHMTSRRAEPESFVVEATGTKVTDGGNYLTDITVTFRLQFPAGDAGDQARQRIDVAMRRSHEVDCTVSRTVELGSPVHFVRVDGS